MVKGHGNPSWPRNSQGWLEKQII